jgi:hypothetical protein
MPLLSNLIGDYRIGAKWSRKNSASEPCENACKKEISTQLGATPESVRGFYLEISGMQARDSS